MTIEDLRVSDDWDRDDELRFRVTGGVEFLSREQVQALIDHLATLMQSDGPTK